MSSPGDALDSNSEDSIDENLRFLHSSLAALDQDQQDDTSTRPPTRSQIDSHRDPRVRNRTRGIADILPSPPPPQAAQYEDRLIVPPHATTPPPPPPPPAESSADRRTRLQQILARLNRIHDPSASAPTPATGRPTASAYSNRTPSPGAGGRAERLYDWAPAHEDTSTTHDETELEQILAELRRARPDIGSERLRGEGERELEGLRRREQEATEGLERRERLRERRRGGVEWGSLRRSVVAQRATRQEGGVPTIASSASATERMLRYVMERERSGMSEEEERARGTGWFNPMDENSGIGAEHLANGNSSRDAWPLPPPHINEGRSSLLRNEEARTAWFAAEQERVMRYRTGTEGPQRLPRISTPPVPSTMTSSSPTALLESALKYLDQLRSCSRYEDALSAAMDQGLATKEFFADKHHDFIMDLDDVEPLADSSWLQPGTTFEGHQHAATPNAELLQQRLNSSTIHVEQINPNFPSLASTPAFDHPPGSTRVASFDASRPWLSHQFTPPTTTNTTTSTSPKFPDPTHDHWPVRVTIHSLDREKMTIQGTMEAYDVPQHPASISLLNNNNASTTSRPKAGRKSSPITTYLEGHIIDLTTHSFLTPTPAVDHSKRSTSTSRLLSSSPISFPSATPSTDAANWLRLPPFSTLASPSALARTLLSLSRLRAIQQEYIFMRWKERCFVHTSSDTCSDEDRRMGDQDRGHGLTIGGFYYVSLRRADGRVEGLYFDPGSTPFQRVRLEGGRGGWPGVELR
ncbi:unnamed protein product [Zymoseptoria tritici ST99CH_1A5]|uniref:Vacuolar import and degradation protein-domain-containing protein n=1 Tax=Zymoseptoria tritici ST99CH_1A5 TaxID=1276529 RepID=A0A1Y6L500_ZYMTR|nr:unnamed protein product [Zymoseptoria tritici ST99CH_1A5]